MKDIYYTESGCTVSGPNGSDRNGVLVATGQHTNHTETGMYEQTTPNAASHCAKCGDCLAKFYPVLSCRWDNRCVRTNVGYHYRYCYDCQGRSIQYCNYVGNTCVMCGGR